MQLSYCLVKETKKTAFMIQIYGIDKGGSREMLLGGGGVPELLGGCELDGASRRRASAAGVWGRKNRSPRVLECT